MEYELREVHHAWLLLDVRRIFRSEGTTKGEDDAVAFEADWDRLRSERARRGIRQSRWRWRHSSCAHFHRCGRNRSDCPALTGSGGRSLRMSLCEIGNPAFRAIFRCAGGETPGPGSTNSLLMSVGLFGAPALPLQTPYQIARIRPCLLRRFG